MLIKMGKFDQHIAIISQSIHSSEMSGRILIFVGNTGAGTNYKDDGRWFFFLLMACGHLTYLNLVPPQSKTNTFYIWGLLGPKRRPLSRQMIFMMLENIVICLVTDSVRFTVISFLGPKSPQQAVGRLM